jgi:lipopolysaccharide export system protein LptA
MGIAPFQAVAPDQRGVPDVAGGLAERFEALGVGRVVGPADLGAPRLGEPSPDRIRSLASGARVGAIVVGRTTRIGGRLSIDVRLRSGLSGGIAGTYVIEVPSPETLDTVVEQLADQVLIGALALAERGGAAVPPIAAVEPLEIPVAPAEREAPAEPAAPQGPPFGLGALQSEAPVSIRSEELEASESDSSRTLVFRGGVEVTQDELVLRSDQLEAVYPSGTRQPAVLSARGAVRLESGDREARCERANYDRAGERIVCDGEAFLRDGADSLRGETVTFDLAERRVLVEGGAEVVLESAASGSGPLAAGDSRLAEGLQEGGPVTIRSARLVGSDGPVERRVRFEGDVVATRDDVTMRSQSLEAIYPAGARQPDRLVAEGGVQVVQGEREASCARAVYHREQQRIECTGVAQLSQGADRVRGETIEFDLATDHVTVRGRTRLQLGARADSERAFP